MGDFGDLGFGHFGEDGEAQDLIGELFGDGAICGGEMGEAGLFVKSFGIINFVADFGGAQVGGEGVAAFARGEAHGELIPRMAGRGGGQNEVGRAGKERLVLRGVAGAQGDPFVELGLLYAEQRGLEFIKSKIAADGFVMIFGLGTVGAQEAGAIGEGIVAGGQQTGVAQRAEVFGGIKTECAKVAHAADGDAFPRGALCLRGVLNDVQRVRFGELADGGHIGGLSKKVDGENGLGALGDFGVSVLGVEVEGIRVGIDEHRCGTRARDTAGGGEESERRA